MHLLHNVEMRPGPLLREALRRRGFRLLSPGAFSGPSAILNIDNITAAEAVPADRDLAWRDLQQVHLPERGVLRRRLADGRTRVPTEPYDLLRTRAGFAMAAAGWQRLAVTQARNGIAAPATALNLALAEARRPGRRVALVELDLQHGALLGLIGRDVSHGTADSQREMLKIHDNLALVAFTAPKDRAAEILLDPRFRTRVADTLAALEPEVVILHMPALLTGDEGLAGLDLADTVLLTVDGARDLPAHLRSAEKLISSRRPLLGLFHYDAER